MIARVRPVNTAYGLRPRVTLRSALSDPALLGNVLVGESWTYWRPVLLATVGEPLTPDELAIFTEITGGRTAPPTEMVDEAAFVIGRRGGKDRACSVLVTYLAALCEYPNLAPGERGLALCIGQDQRQAKVTRNYIEAAFHSSPVLSQLVANLTQDSIQLTNRIDIEVRAASFRRVRGPTCIAVIATESAFWLGEDSSNPDTEILNALRPTLATTGGPLIQISSPYARRGELWETYKRHFGPDGDPRILVVQGPSRTFNPTLPESVVQRALEKDRAAAAAEYGAEFRSDLEAFVSREIIEGCMDKGVHERAPISSLTYFAFFDGAGGSGTDSQVVVVGHREGDVAFVDAIRETRPPFSPSVSIRRFAELLDTYRIRTVHGDRWAGEWPRELWRECGISYECSAKSASDLYVDALPLLNSGRVRLLDHGRANSQLIALERRTSRAGKDSITHPPSGHDDLAVSVAGVLVAAAGARKQIKVSGTALAMAAQPATANRYNPYPSGRPTTQWAKNFFG